MITNLCGSNQFCTPNLGSGGPYGASTVSAFGSSGMLAFGLSSTPALRFGSTPSFGQSSNAFVGSSVGTNPSSYGAQSSHFGDYFIHFILFMQLQLLNFFQEASNF